MQEREIQIAKTLYRVTEEYAGKRELSKTLEQLALRQAMAAFIETVNSSAIHKHELPNLFLKIGGKANE